MSVDGQQQRPPNRRGIAGRVIDAVVSPIVTPVIDAVDVGDVVDRIDVEGVVERIDVDALMDRVDVDRLLDRIDVDALLDRIDVEALLGRIDVDNLLGRIDVDKLLARISVQALLDRIDIGALIGRVDMNAVIGSVDMNALLAGVDVDALIQKVDVEAMIDRVDMNAVVGKVDMNAIMERTELGAIIARSTTGVFGELLDTARAIVLTVDLVTQATVGQIVRPRREQRPGRPGAPDDVVDDLRTLTAAERGVALQGHHAGSVSRFLAFLADAFLIGLLFGVGQSLIDLATQVVLGETWDPAEHRGVVMVMYVLWSFVYLAAQLGATGRTIGMALAGLQVVRSNGDHLDGRHAALRTLVFPLSFVLFGVGLLIGLLRRDRRELHDLIADTAVIYAWDAEIARLRHRASAQPVADRSEPAPAPSDAPSTSPATTASPADDAPAPPAVEAEQPVEAEPETTAPAVDAPATNGAQPAVNGAQPATTSSDASATVS